MELLHQIEVKKMNPKKGFTAPYIRFPWGYDRALIGKPVSIYKVEGGFFVALENKEFKLKNIEKVIKELSMPNFDEFKPNKKLKNPDNALEFKKKNAWSRS